MAGNLAPEAVTVPPRNQITRALLFVAGSLFVAIGVVGIFLPLLPTTIFLILASFCYANSSARAHRWLTGNRMFGGYLRRYQEERAMPRRAKVVAIGMLWVGIGLSAWFIGVLWVALVLAAVAAGVTVYLVRLRSGGSEKFEV